MKYSHIKQAVVTVKEKDGVNKYLCAYYVSDGDVKDSEFNVFLSQHLPEYMLPSVYVRLGGIPLMQNGKADRKLLKEKQVEVGGDHPGENRQTVEKQDHLSLRIKEIICSKIEKKLDLISLKNDSVLKNIGVNSIIMVGIIISLETELGFQFSDEDFYTNRFITIQDLIDYAGQKLEK
jgi:acyl carrier protein